MSSQTDCQTRPKLSGITRREFESEYFGSPDEVPQVSSMGYSDTEYAGELLRTSKGILQVTKHGDRWIPNAPRVGERARTTPRKMQYFPVNILPPRSFLQTARSAGPVSLADLFGEGDELDIGEIGEDAVDFNLGARGPSRRRDAPEGSLEFYGMHIIEPHSQVRPRA